MRDDTTDFPFGVRMLDNAKARYEQNSYSRTEPAAQDRRDFKNQKIRNDAIRQSLRLGIQTTLLDKVVQRRILWFGQVERMPVYRFSHIAL